MDDVYCNKTHKPDDLQRTCNAHLCPARYKIQSPGFYIKSLNINTNLLVICIFKYCSVLYVDGGQDPGNIVPSRVVQMVSIKEQLYACAASEVMNRSLLKISRAKERRNPSKWNRVITKIHAPVQQSGQLEIGQR